MLRLPFLHGRNRYDHRPPLAVTTVLVFVDVGVHERLPKSINRTNDVAEPGGNQPLNRTVWPYVAILGATDTCGGAGGL
jgi:hypothetical protein